MKLYTDLWDHHRQRSFFFFFFPQVVAFGKFQKRLSNDTFLSLNVVCVLQEQHREQRLIAQENCDLPEEVSRSLSTGQGVLPPVDADKSCHKWLILPGGAFKEGDTSGGRWAWLWATVYFSWPPSQTAPRFNETELSCHSGERLSYWSLILQLFPSLRIVFGDRQVSFKNCAHAMLFCVFFITTNCFGSSRLVWMVV